MKTKVDINQLAQAVNNRQIQTPVNQNSGWLSYWEVLSLILLIFKFTGYFTASWFWVFSPLLVPFIVYISIILCGFITTKFFKNK
jgi:hypothetical protein